MSLGISQANTKLCSAAHFFKNEESPNAEANNSGSQSPAPQNKVSVWRQNVARRRHSLRVSTVWLRILREFLRWFLHHYFCWILPSNFISSRYINFILCNFFLEVPTLDQICLYEKYTFSKLGRVFIRMLLNSLNCLGFNGNLFYTLSHESNRKTTR